MGALTQAELRALSPSPPACPGGVPRTCATTCSCPASAAASRRAALPKLQPSTTLSVARKAMARLEGTETLEGARGPEEGLARKEHRRSGCAQACRWAGEALE